MKKHPPMKNAVPNAVTNAVANAVTNLEWHSVTGRDHEGDRVNRHLLADTEGRIYCRIYGPLYAGDTYQCDLWLEGTGFDRHYLTLEAAQAHCLRVTLEYFEKRAPDHLAHGEEKPKDPGNPKPSFWRWLFRRKATA